MSGAAKRATWESFYDEVVAVPAASIGAPGPPTTWAGEGRQAGAAREAGGGTEPAQVMSGQARRERGQRDRGLPGAGRHKSRKAE